MPFPQEPDRIHGKCSPWNRTFLLIVGIQAATVQLRGQASGPFASPGSATIRGILEVDPQSGAASLYFSLGPGISTPSFRYLPALVGRFAPQVGVQQRPGSGSGPEPALLAATAFELSPGYLDLPLALQEAGAPGASITWTYPDGTGGAARLASTSTLDPKAVLLRFGYFGKRVMSPRLGSDPGTEVLAGSGGDYLIFLDDELVQPTIPASHRAVKGLPSASQSPPVPWSFAATSPSNTGSPNPGLGSPTKPLNSAITA